MNDICFNRVKIIMGMYDFTINHGELCMLTKTKKFVYVYVLSDFYVFTLFFFDFFSRVILFCFCKI